MLFWKRSPDSTIKSRIRSLGHGGGRSLLPDCLRRVNLLRVERLLGAHALLDRASALLLQQRLLVDTGWQQLPRLLQASHCRLATIPLLPKCCLVLPHLLVNSRLLLVHQLFFVQLLPLHCAR